MMMINKPSIHIYIDQADPQILKEICAGIEEEGVPYEIRDVSRENRSSKPENSGIAERPAESLGDPAGLAFLAAEESVLGTGIGIVDDTAAMTLRKIPKETPVYLLQNPEAAKCRNLGTDSARAVKRKPFRGFAKT